MRNEISLKRISTNGWELRVPTEYLGFVRKISSGSIFGDWEWAAYNGRNRAQGVEKSALTAVRKAFAAARPMFSRYDRFADGRVWASGVAEVTLRSVHPKGARFVRLLGAVSR